MMKCYSHSCIGEGHTISRKPCQDFSLHYSDEETGVNIVIVCDGHGGERYFRSDKGAQVLGEIARETLLKFTKGIKQLNEKGSHLFSRCSLTKLPAQKDRTTIITDYREEVGQVEQLLGSIVTQWKDEIGKDASGRSITEWERSNVKPEYIEAFEQKNSIERAYGCTLIAFLHTQDYWLAFQIGDGKCIMFDHEDNCIEPILWDDRCFLNRTTSICDPAPIEEFRYSFSGNKNIPVAVFLGSDGIDDSYGDGERLKGFYINILRMLVLEGDDAVQKSIVEDLPQISRIGSHDDMSIAYLYDDVNLKEHVNNLTRKQLAQTDSTIEHLREKIREKKNAIDEIAGDVESKLAESNFAKSKEYQKLRVNLKFRFSDFNMLSKEIETLAVQANSLRDFLGEAGKSYNLDNDKPQYYDNIPSLIDYKRIGQGHSETERNGINEENISDEASKIAKYSPIEEESKRNEKNEFGQK